MKLTPSIGMAFILEDKRDFGDSGIDIPDQAKVGVGTTGVVVAVTNLTDLQPTLYFDALMSHMGWKNGTMPVFSSTELEMLKDFCGKMEMGRDRVDQYKEGDHVVFSKFNEQICIYENGKEIIYYQVPVQSILGFIHD